MMLVSLIVITCKSGRLDKLLVILEKNEEKKKEKEK